MESVIPDSFSKFDNCRYNARIVSTIKKYLNRLAVSFVYQEFRKLLYTF